MALVGLAMFGFGAVALDQGVGMADRRDLQATVDSASLAGARSSSAGTATEHWIAAQYMAKSLNFNISAMSGQGCTSATVCPAKTYTVGNYTFTLADSGSGLDVSVQHSRRTLLAGVLGINTAVAGTAARAQPGGPITLPANYALVGLGGNLLINGGGVRADPSGDVGGAVYASGNFGTNNAQHPASLPSTPVDGATGLACPGGSANHVDVGGGSNNLDYTVGGASNGGLNTGQTAPSGFSGQAPLTRGPTFSNGASGAKDVAGKWNPGTYVGWYPTSGLLNPGVYVIKSVSNGISLHDLNNAIPAPQGTVDAAGAVAFVLDSSDNGSALNFSNSTLNGIDDLTGTGTNPDPQGTHNFVVYGAGFTGTTDFGSSTLSGIIYLPNSNALSDGNSSYTFSGSVWLNSYSLNGGGNGLQVFHWVCGLSSVSSNQGGSGLVR